MESMSSGAPLSELSSNFQPFWAAGCLYIAHVPGRHKMPSKAWTRGSCCKSCWPNRRQRATKSAASAHAARGSSRLTSLLMLGIIRTYVNLHPLAGQLTLKILVRHRILRGGHQNRPKPSVLVGPLATHRTTGRFLCLMLAAIGCRAHPHANRQGHTEFVRRRDSCAINAISALLLMGNAAEPSFQFSHAADRLAKTSHRV